MGRLTPRGGGDHEKRGWPTEKKMLSQTCTEQASFQIVGKTPKAKGGRVGLSGSLPHGLRPARGAA